MRLIDTHCHLSDARFAADLPAVLDRAAAAGVERMLCIATGLDDAVAVAALRDAHPGRIGATIGIDPGRVQACGDGLDAAVAELERRIAGGGWRAVGECGIECHHDYDPLPRQIAAFAAQVDLAVAAGLPLVIHARRGRHGDAHAIALDVLAARPAARGVIHSFDGDPDLARRWLDRGFHLAFNGMLTFKGNDELRRSAAGMPADRMLVETDAPYLSPVPLRGRRNEPAHIVHTVAMLADVRGMPAEEAAAWTTRNAGTLFFAGG